MRNSLQLIPKIIIESLKNKISTTRVCAALAVNKEVLQLYWQIEAGIIELEKNAAWGDRMYQKLSNDLGELFPGSRGYSTTNFKRMRLFAETYPDLKIGEQVVHQLPWGQIIVLLHKLLTPGKRHFDRNLRRVWIRTSLFATGGTNELILTR